MPVVAFIDTGSCYRLLLTMSTAGNYTNEIEVAAGFLGFWKNFIDTFDMKGRKISITGESYAGNYVSSGNDRWCPLPSFDCATDFLFAYYYIADMRDGRCPISPKPCSIRLERSLNHTIMSLAS